MHTWQITVRRHPDLSPLIANLARIETIKRTFESEGFSVRNTDKRSVFRVLHASEYAMDLVLLKHGLPYCDCVLETPKNANL